MFGDGEEKAWMLTGLAKPDWWFLQGVLQTSTTIFACAFGSYFLQHFLFYNPTTTTIILTTTSSITIPKPATIQHLHPPPPCPPPAQVSASSSTPPPNHTPTTTPRTSAPISPDGDTNQPMPPTPPPPCNHPNRHKTPTSDSTIVP